MSKHKLNHTNYNPNYRPWKSGYRPWQTVNPQTGRSERKFAEHEDKKMSKVLTADFSDIERRVVALYCGGESTDLPLQEGSVTGRWVHNGPNFIEVEKTPTGLTAKSPIFPNPPMRGGPTEEQHFKSDLHFQAILQRMKLPAREMNPWLYDLICT